MGVHGDARHAKGIAEHNVRGLAPHPRQGDELLEGAGNLTAVLLSDGGTETDEGTGLGLVKTGGPDDLSELLGIRSGVVSRGGI